MRERIERPERQACAQLAGARLARRAVARHQDGGLLALDRHDRGGEPDLDRGEGRGGHGRECSDPPLAVIAAKLVPAKAGSARGHGGSVAIQLSVSCPRSRHQARTRHQPLHGREGVGRLVPAANRATTRVAPIGAKLRACPGRSAAAQTLVCAGALQEPGPFRSSVAVPDQRRTAPQELRAAPHPGHEHWLQLSANEGRPYRPAPRRCEHPYGRPSWAPLMAIRVVFYCFSGTVIGLPLSATMTARTLAGSVWLAFADTACSWPGAS